MSLRWLMTSPALKGRLLNWAYRLRAFDFTVIYRKGVENHVADMLSRLVFLAGASREVRQTCEEVYREGIIEKGWKDLDSKRGGAQEGTLPSRTVLLQVQKETGPRPKGQ